MRRQLIAVLCLLLLIPAVSAREIRSGQDCEVAAGDVVEGVLIAFCETLSINGMVRGDVFAATVNTRITGIVDGSVYALSGEMTISGIVTEDVHYGGIVLRVNPLDAESDTPDSRYLGGGLKVLSLSTIVADNTTIERTVLNVGYQLILDGDVESEVNFWGSTLIIGGRVDGDVYAVVGDRDSDSSQIETLLFPLQIDVSLLNPGLTVRETASIDGQISYTGPQMGDIRGIVSEGLFYEPPPPVLPSLDEPGALALMVQQFGQEFASLAIIGMLALAVTNNIIYAPLTQLRTRPFNSLGVGLLAFLLSFPIVLIAIVLTLVVLVFFEVIGLSGVVLALGVVLGLVNVGWISIFYFLAIFLGRALVGLAIGRTVLRLMFGRNAIDRRSMLYTAMLIGVGLLAVLVSLPAIGWVINAAALFFGLGAVLNVMINQIRRLRDSSPVPAPAWRTPSPAVTRPHTIRSDTQRVLPKPIEPDEPPVPASLPTASPKKPPQLSSPGSTNLPDGFDWSFFDDDE